MTTRPPGKQPWSRITRATSYDRKLSVLKVEISENESAISAGRANYRLLSQSKLGVNYDGKSHALCGRARGA